MFSENSVVGLTKLDGTITPFEFNQACHDFALKWSTICHDHDLPPWFWVDGYLSLEKMCILRSDKIDDNVVSHAGEEERNWFESKTSTEPEILATDDVHYYDFHIVYSNSYRMPVLYFRGYNSDGQPLTLSQIEIDLPANSAKVLTESKWTFITQLEHPYLNRPWYTLHPCGTNELMKLLINTLSKSEDTPVRYLISWLSVVSQVVGLKIPLQISTTHRS
ncbi:hypothetical protein RND81_02G015200 [Saponaria officinalis]|uniref:Ubiquitin-like-conjugating enzyme ATG10 n=1 Tax=Saponaria officinalis TaxID=3572 RepID=A0AAW1MP72_SAPOF